ncbi:MAG: two-component system, OmpR family, response regulator [Chthoniobacter sp.]|nr:two-component system, OmpR family, response regulator [Chthoniobacter sp.]
MLKLTLSEHEVREENDAERALETAREWQPDIILLDVVMPKMDGGELAAAIRADPALSDVPVVFLTAIVSPEEAASRKLLSGFPFLAKPISAENLRECLAEHLPRSSALESLTRRVVDGAKRLTGLFTDDPA